MPIDRPPPHSSPPRPHKPRASDTHLAPSQRHKSQAFARTFATLKASLPLIIHIKFQNLIDYSTRFILHLFVCMCWVTVGVKMRSEGRHLRGIESGAQSARRAQSFGRAAARSSGCGRARAYFYNERKRRRIWARGEINLVPIAHARCLH